MTNGSTRSSGSGRPSIIPILSVNFVGTLGFSIVVPFMVFLVADWGGNAIIYGALASTYSAFQLLGAPILGKWSDSIGRRKVLLLSQLGTMVSWVIFLAAFLLPVMAALVISIIASFLILFGLPGSRQHILNAKPGLPNACKVFGQETKEGYRLEGCDETSYAQIIRLPQMPALLSVNFLVMLGFSFFYIAFPTHAALGLDWTVTDTGVFFAW
ncbi:MAG: major facilitator superfamily domain-containing protein 9 [Hyphomicrobiales bacterium]|nr:major facilitator superfamily domain-containing protein 9 [Hyphomicrobiales bacterium]MCP5000739.1 major facilitator superfamily domain-containing protein 9 [Hyphomicrobiales bacterium]